MITERTLKNFLANRRVSHAALASTAGLSVTDLNAFLEGESLAPYKIRQLHHCILSWDARIVAYYEGVAVLSELADEIWDLIEVSTTRYEHQDPEEFWEKFLCNCKILEQ